MGFGITIFSVVVLISFLIIPIQSTQSQKSFNSEELGLGVPTISMNPMGGPPGTQVSIIIANMPTIPQGLDPRIEFFVYLPFVSAIGSNVPHNCEKEYCIPLYSFEEVGSGKIAQKTITFTLFSKSNPKPTVQAGLVVSVCDLKINGKTIERYGNTCFEKNQPVGDYPIKFAWGIQRTDVYDVIETKVFTVTEGVAPPPTPVKKPDEIVIQQFQQGLLTEEEFEQQLRKFGYDDQEIRRAKALIGMLEHQKAAKLPEQKQSVEQVTQTQETAPQETQTQETTTPQSNQNGGGCLIATAAYGSELAPQVQQLREIRDNKLLQTASGSAFMNSFNQFYYSFSPTISDWERENSAFKETVKIAITPMITSLSFLNYVEIDSEYEMIVYGTSLILLNVGMYFAAPAILISKIRKFRLM